MSHDVVYYLESGVTQRAVMGSFPYSILNTGRRCALVSYILTCPYPVPVTTMGWGPQSGTETTLLTHTGTLRSSESGLT